MLFVFLSDKLLSSSHVRAEPEAFLALSPDDRVVVHTEERYTSQALANIIGQTRCERPAAGCDSNSNFHTKSSAT